MSLSSHGSPNSGSVSPTFSSQPSSLASLPIRVSSAPNPPLQQTNIMPIYGSTTFGATKPDQHPFLEQGIAVNPPLPTLNSAEVQIASDFPEFESETCSFKPLEEDTESSQSLMSSVLSSPHIAEQQQAVLNSIQRTQVRNRFFSKIDITISIFITYHSQSI